MTAIKHTLQREVFLPSEECLIAVVHIAKAGKKKKSSFLCAAVTTEKPIQALIYQVKKLDRGDAFKKKLSWVLRELKVLDAKEDGAEFEMQFDKVYKWIASSISEKNAFIQCLWKLSQRYLVQKPKFINTPAGLLEELSQSSDAGQSAQNFDMSMVSDADWQALSPREEADIALLLSGSEDAICNAEAFANQLSKDLSLLDGANVYSIMGCEEQVLELMMLLDEAIQEATVVENCLNEYDHKLQGVKDLMEFMRDKDTLIQVRKTNHQKLMQELDSTVSCLDLDHKYMRCLLDGDLSSPQGIQECTEAALRLQKCTAAQIHPAMARMAAVQEQWKKFARLKGTFAMRLAHHFNNLFIHQGNELCDTIGMTPIDLKFPRHNSSQRDLLPYADLMSWLKKAEPQSFEKLAKVYTSSLSRLYDREVHEFMDMAKVKLHAGPTKMDRKGSLLPSQRFGLGDSSSSLHKTFDISRNVRSGSLSTLDSDSHHGSDLDLSAGAKMDQMFERVLSELEPVVLAEQDFCVQFFHLTTTESVDQAEAGSSTPGQPSAKQRQINKEMRRMMTELFPSLESELVSFISYQDQQNNLFSLYMLVRMSEHVTNAEDTDSFLSKTFGNCLVHIKRNFDKFIQTQIQTIEDSKLSKKSKVGIMPFVHGFEDFAQQAESIFKGSDRRMDLDKAYVRLIGVIFKEIERLASESHRTPSQVVMFENYHHIYALLSQLKIASLENQRKEARIKYQEHLQVFVIQYLGRPMEKLQTFFEGVENRVAAGVKEEEVGYQLAYSKQELRKVILLYPSKEIKKGLEHLYKKVEKHLCEEENLLQVVWHSMQDEFLKQYKHYETLITHCYPSSGITLEFTISDLLAFFSDIALTH